MPIVAEVRRYVAADQLEAEVEDLYGRIEVPTHWAEGLRQEIASEVVTHHEDTTAERELLAHRCEHAEAERYKLMKAYYANAIDVTMLRREQERIGAELRAIESRQATLDAVHVRDGDVVGATHEEPFDLLFAVPEFEYGGVVGREGFEPP